MLGRKKHEMDMLHGSLADKMLLFALPLGASSMLQQLFNSADVAVVGHFASKQALAAVGSNAPVINLLINLFVGISIGTNVVLAECIGRGEQGRIKDAVHTAILFAFCSGVFLMGLGQIVAQPILTMMNAPEDVMDAAVLYLRLYFLGMPFFMLYNYGSAILRSKGDTARPLYALFFSGIVNVLLNLFFVIVCKMDVAGVALATAASHVVSACLVLRFLLREEGVFKLEPRLLKFHSRHLLRMVRVGAPAGLQGMLFSISNVCIQTAINGFGANVMSGTAVSMNYEYFAFFAVSAFSQTTVTFIGQNYGAGLQERCKKIVRIGLLSAILASGTMIAAFVLFRYQFASVYTSDPEVLHFAVIRLVRVLSFQWMVATYEICGSALRGMGFSLLPMVMTLLGSCAFRLVWLSTVFRIWPTYEVLLAVYPVTWLITGPSVMQAYYLVSRRQFRLLAEKERQEA